MNRLMLPLRSFRERATKLTVSWGTMGDEAVVYNQDRKRAQENTSKRKRLKSKRRELRGV